MIPFHKIKKQLCSDPEILDHFIMSEDQIIDDIKLKVINANEDNDIEIEEDEAEVIAKEYYENNKEEIQDVIRNYFDYISNSDNYLCDIEFEESDLLKKI
jgi:hypothetical protein